MRTSRILMLFAMTSLFAACAHHKDVRPGADGVHRVVVAGPEKGPLSEDALRQATYFCEKQQKGIGIISEDAKYTGSMDESTHNNLRTASKVAGAVGGGLAVFGGNNERNAGKVAIGTGVVGGVVTGGDAYTVEMRFKCQ